MVLEDFLRYCGAQGVYLALELKAPDIECEVYEMVKRFGLLDKVTITSFNLEYLIALKRAYPEAKAGYLKAEFDDETVKEMKKLGIGQLCPSGQSLTPEKVADWHSQGFNVRAWGIKDVTLMKYAYDCGVNGMTVNFPDRLIEYIVKKQGEI